MIKVPERTPLVYIFDVCASQEASLPKILAVDAVGMIQPVNEFLTPFSTTSCLSFSQSHLLVGLTPHKSNWNLPSDKGEPLNVA